MDKLTDTGNYIGPGARVGLFVLDPSLLIAWMNDRTLVFYVSGHDEGAWMVKKNEEARA